LEDSDFEHLNMIYHSSNQEGESILLAKCENYEFLQGKVKYQQKLIQN